MPTQGVVGVLRESSAVNWLAGRSEEWPVCLWVTSHTTDLLWHSDCIPKVQVCAYAFVSFALKHLKRSGPQSSVFTDWQQEDMLDALGPDRRLREDRTLGRARFANLWRVNMPQAIRATLSHTMSWIHSKDTPRGQRTPSSAMWFIRTQQQTKKLGYRAAQI